MARASTDPETMVVDEFPRCVTLLENTRSAALKDARPRRSSRRDEEDEARRLLRSRFRSLGGYVIAVWGTPKDGFPPLDDPR